MAGKTIKGITIQIDGNATGLGKVLKEIDKESGKLAGNLKQVNAALKLDPTNTELLSQKQRILGDAIENTAVRLEALKKAQEEASKSVGNYDAWAAAYKPIQTQIVATKERIQELSAQQKEMADTGDTTSDAYQALGKQIESLNGDLKDLRKQAKAVSDEFGNPISQDEYDKLQREIVFTNNKLQNLSKELDDTEAEMSDLGKDTATAEKKLDDFADAADDAEKSSSSMGKTLSGGLMTGIKAVGVAVGSLITGIVAASESTEEYRGEIGKLNTAFSSNDHSAKAATATYKSLQGVIGETDQTVEAAQQIALLADSEERAGQWAGYAAGLVGKFGDALQPETFYESANETLKLSEATGAFTQMLEGCGMNVEQFNADLAACTTEQEKQALMLSVTEEALGEAAESYRKNNAEIIRANEANDSWMQSLAAIGGAIGPIITDIKVMGASLLSDFVPGVQAVAESIRGILNGDSGASAALGESISNIITGLLSKVTDLAPTVAQVGISLLTSLTTTVMEQAPGVVRTGMKIAAEAIASLATVLPSLVSDLIANVIPGIITNILAYTPDLLEAAVLLFNSFVQAIPITVAELIAWLPEIIQGIVDAVVLGIPLLLDAAMQLFSSLVQAVQMVIPQLIEALPLIIETLVAGVAESVPQMIDGALQLLNGIIQAIPIIIETLVPQIPTIVTTIIDGLIQLTPQLIDGALELLTGIIQAVPMIAQTLAPEIPLIVTTMIDGLIQLTPQLIGGAFTLLMGIVEAIPQIVVEIGKAMPQVVEALVGGLLEAVNAIGEKMDDAGQLVKEGIEKIKGFFNFKFEWPKLKLPHFSVKPKGWEIGDLLKGSIPTLSISWYAKGGILPSAAIFGAYGGKLLGGGEAGQEAILPLDSFYQNLEAILARNRGGSSGLVVQVNIDHFVNSGGQDIEELASAVADAMQIEIMRREAAF